MYAVIFYSTRTTHSEEMYQQHSEMMETFVKGIKGYISHHSHRDPITREGLTISYFDSLEAVKAWRDHAEHRRTQELGRKNFYESYEVKVVKVEQEYRWKSREIFESQNGN